MIHGYEPGKGALTYTGIDRVLLTEGLEDYEDLYVETKIDPPVGATYGSVGGLKRDNGPVILQTACTQNEGEFPTNPRLFRYKIVWYDNDENLVSSEYLWITFVNATGDVWTHGRWDAIEADRIEVNESFAGSNVNIYTDDGSIDVRFESGVLPKVGQLQTPYFTLQPPTAAVKYKAALQSGPKYATDTRPGIETELNGMALKTIPLGGVPFSPGLMQQTNIADSLLTLWYSKNLSSSYADTIVIDWYDENETKLTSEYVMCTVGKFALIIEEPAVGDLPNAPVQNPTVISENNWVLRTEYVPQSGEDAVFYELSLKDKDGGVLSSIEQGAPVVLPFPEGMDYVDALGYNFVIRHYNIELDSFEVIEAEVKECGLIFTAKSFSPYMLLWESDESAGPIVTFDAGGGAFYDGKTTMNKRANKDGKVEIPDSIYQWGHAFQGWYTDEAFPEESEWDFATDQVIDDITLYAKWETAEPSLTITALPATHNYTKGDRLDLAGLCINVVFDEEYDPAGWPMAWGEESWSDEVTTDPADGAVLTMADTEVTIRFMEKSAKFTINVGAGGSTGGPSVPAMNTVTDQNTTQTGASVTGELPSGAVLTVGALTLPAKGKNAAADAMRAEMGRADALVLLAKDIKLSVGFTGKLTVTLPIDAKYNGQTVTILHESNGKLERYTAVVTNGQVVFEVTSLSPFVVLLYSAAVKVPNTGAPAETFPFVLLALGGAAGIAAYRKRARGKGK